jgi:hypothetical protein
VDRQASGLRESLAASGAGPRKVAGMVVHVCRQGVGPRKLFVADGARIWTLACVRSHMNYQVAGRDAYLTAYDTRVHHSIPWACVRGCN